MFSCKENNNNISYKDISISCISSAEYKRVFQLANDSIKNWALNNLGYYQYLEKSKKYLLDSLLCFNKEKNKFVCCLLKQQELKEGVADDMDYFYGTKINNQWYFFSGANVFLPRNMYQKDIHTPLSFTKLHEIALKEIYSGYLTNDGEINEQFFKDNFEDTGWGVTSGKKEDFEKAYLQKVANNWYGAKKDTANKVLP